MNSTGAAHIRFMGFLGLTKQAAGLLGALQQLHPPGGPLPVMDDRMLPRHVPHSQSQLLWIVYVVEFG